MGLLQSALTTELVLSSRSYIFDGAGEMKETLLKAILDELQAKQYPLPAKIETVKSPGILFGGSKEECVTVALTTSERLIIATTTVGTYLYVCIYHMVRVLNGQAQAILANRFVVTDIFAEQTKRAACSAAIAATKSAFAKFSLVPFAEENTTPAAVSV